MASDKVESEGLAGCDVCLPSPGLSFFAKERIFGPMSDWIPLCMPSYPCQKERKPLPFFAKDAKIPLVVALIMGLQHMLAMLGGIITPPKLIANDGCVLGRDPELCGKMPYLICATLLTSGLLTLVQVTRIPLGNSGYFIGTGLISVMGPSFGFLPIAREMVQATFGDDSKSGVEAYGEFLGTCLVACLFEIGLSFIPPKTLRKLCPPVVSGVTVFLIGCSLTATGVKYWGGGVFCSENIMSRPMAGASTGNMFILGPQNCQGDNGGNSWSFGQTEWSPGYAPENKDGVALYYGDSQYIGLGFLVIVFFIFFELFGPPFVKNCNVAISLMLGYAVSAGCYYDQGGVRQEFVTGQFTRTADWITFLWVETFPLGFDGKAFLPLVIAFFTSTAETIGDINASVDASQLPTEGADVQSRVQGGLLADGINSFLAALFTTPPNTTFSQNNGVIAITRCASRLAGYACAGWLIFFGIIGKFGGFVADIPICVLGGMVTILFASILVSGIAVLSKIEFNRRNRIILSLSLGIGLGVVAVPDFVQAGGPASFYGPTLNMNMGLWPKKRVCISGTEVYFDGTQDGVNNTASFNMGVGPLGGFTGGNDLTYSYQVAPTDWVRTCSFDEDLEFWRDVVLILLKTPYSIGFIVALLLNAILPHDPEDTAAPKTSTSAASSAQVSSA